MGRKQPKLSKIKYTDLKEAISLVTKCTPPYFKGMFG